MSTYCKKCGELTDSTAVHVCPKADFFTLRTGPAISGARKLRLAVITNVWLQGKLTTEEAQALLAAPLNSGDETTRYDDSALLGVSNGLEMII